MLNRTEIENRWKPLKSFMEKYAGWIAIVIVMLILYLMMKEQISAGADVAKTIVGAAKAQCGVPPS